MIEVKLRPLTLGDTQNIVKWRNNIAVKKNLYSQDELTPEQHIKYFENMVETKKCVQFIIELNTDGFISDIGTAFIKNIDYRNRNGEFGIFIGEDNARGKGYASIATNKIVAYGFEVMNLNRIFLTVMSDNIPAIKTYEKVGFIHEGVMREEYLRDDGYVDVILMSILRSEWEGKTS